MNKYIKLSIGAAIGALGGYAYYYFVGCTSGSCPLTSNWYVTTLYGFAAGIVAVFPGGKKKEQNPGNEN